MGREVRSGKNRGKGEIISKKRGHTDEEMGG